MKFRNLLFFCTCAIFAGVVNAGVGSGNVARVLVIDSGIVIIKTTNTSAQPSCSVASEYALSLSTVAGRAMYATVLSAQSQGKPITIQGGGVCSVWGDREDVLFVFY